MPLYIGEYRKDTAHLSAAQHGAYLLLIMHYWATETPPPDDNAQLARIACMSVGEWRKARPIIEKLFQQPGWTHKRVEFELTEAARISAAGKAGGEASSRSRRGAKDQRSANDRSTTDERSFNDRTNDQLNDPPTNGQALPSPLPFKKELASSLERGKSAAIDLRVSITEAFEAANSPNPPDTARAEVWLSQGFDAAIILAVVRDLLAKKPGISTLNYFDNAIREAHEKKNPRPRETAPLDWNVWVEKYAKTGFWLPTLGPEPGMGGCTCPSEILRLHGIDPETGRPNVKIAS